MHTWLMYMDNKCKHLIQFPISTELEKVRNSVESYTSNEKFPTVLLKDDTGADVNLMDSRTFNSLFNGNRTIFQPSLLRIEAYRNSAVELLGKFHAFLRWKGRVYRQLFYVTSVNNSITQIAFEGWLLHTQCDQTLSLCGIDRKFQQVPRKSRSDTHTTYSCLRESKVVHLFIVEMKKLRWLNRLIPTKKQYQEG